MKSTALLVAGEGATKRNESCVRTKHIRDAMCVASRMCVFNCRVRSCVRVRVACVNRMLTHHISHASHHNDFQCAHNATIRNCVAFDDATCRAFIQRNDHCVAHVDFFAGRCHCVSLKNALHVACITCMQRTMRCDQIAFVASSSTTLNRCAMRCARMLIASIRNATCVAFTSQ